MPEPLIGLHSTKQTNRSSETGCGTRAESRMAKHRQTQLEEVHYEITVGIPSFLVPPFAFGISTCFTGGGKYEPDDIRFHSLYKFFDRFCSKIAIVSSSIPAAPRLAFTC